jgi:hypothetical protein
MCAMHNNNQSLCAMHVTFQVWQLLLQGFYTYKNFYNIIEMMK